MDLLSQANIANCICGKNHEVDVRILKTSTNISKTLNQTLKEIEQIQKASNSNNKKDNSHIEKSILMICDPNTYIYAGEEISKIKLPMALHICILEPKEVHQALIPDENVIKKASDAISKGTWILLAVGSGTITDITRFVAFQANIPFISIPTAPSVDGFASSVAALINEGQKITYPTRSPIAIIAHLPFLNRSPLKMKAAGLGDLIGKKTCRLDWILGQIFNGESLCAYTANLVQHALDTTLENFDLDNPYSESMLKTLIEGLILAGLAIAMEGTSRPASGSEHHISHFLELSALEGKCNHYLHGETVSVGTYLISMLYQKIFELNFEEFEQIVLNNLSIHDFDNNYRKKRIKILKEAYSPSPKIYIDRFNKFLKPIDEIPGILTILKREWTNIQNDVKKYLGTESELQKMLDQANVPYDANKLKISPHLVKFALIGAKEIRLRFTILTLLDDLRILPIFADKILENIP